MNEAPPILLKNLLKNIVKLEDDAFYDLILAFFLIPSAISQSAPILLAWGASGSGKSRVLQFGAELHDTTILSSTSTAVSVRNQIEMARFDASGRERNYCFFLDDVKAAKILAEDHLYAILRNGCYRKTGNYAISSEVGINKNFRIFCPKGLSTIEEFWNTEAFSELKRRALIIPCKKIESINGDNELLEIEAINWNGFSDLPLFFWNDRNRLSLYASILRTASSNRPKSIEKARWGICGSVYASLVATEIVESAKEAKDLLEHCLREMEKNTPKPTFEKVLELFLTHKRDEMTRFNQPIVISVEEIQKHLGELRRKGVIDKHTLKETKFACERMGWVYRLNSEGGYYTHKEV